MERCFSIVCVLAVVLMFCTSSNVRSEASSGEFNITVAQRLVSRRVYAQVVKDADHSKLHAVCLCLTHPRWCDYRTLPFMQSVRCWMVVRATRLYRAK